MSTKNDEPGLIPLMITKRRTIVLISIALFAAFVIYSTIVSFPRLELLANDNISNPLVLQESSLIKKNVAVIIEDRALGMLVPLILHFSSVLGPEWPIILYTSQEILPKSAPFHRAIDESRISVRSLPPNVHFTDHSSVSNFLTKPWLWGQLAPAEHVLLFQPDSIICANSPLRVEDFLDYDFVGAPIVGHGEGYNGGLSLRNRSAILDIARGASWQAEKETAENPYDPSVEFEDQWFYKKLKALPDSRLPSIDVAMTFSVETIWYDRPLGFHQVNRWQSEHVKEVDDWCPEHRMTTSNLIVNH